MAGSGDNTRMAIHADDSGEQKLRKMAATFIPGWNPGETTGAMSGLFDIAGYYDDIFSQVMLQAKKKAKLVGLDAMGAELRQASPATAEVVFTAEANPLAESPVINARTSLSANGQSGTVFFETENDVALVTSPLDKILYATDSGIRSITPGKSVSIKTLDYLLIGNKYPLVPGTTIQIDIELKPLFSNSNNGLWQIWTGKWEDLHMTEDQTDGLQHSGSITITIGDSEKIQSVLMNFNEIDAHWIRLVLTPETMQRNCKLTRLQIHVAIDNKHQFALTDSFVNGLKVDPTSVFAPFGEAPRPGAEWLFGVGDAAARPNANVTITFDVVPDPMPPTTQSSASTSGGSPNTLTSSAMKVASTALTSISNANTWLQKLLPSYAWIVELSVFLFSYVASGGSTAWNWVSPILTWIKNRLPFLASSTQQSPTTTNPQPSGNTNPAAVTTPTSNSSQSQNLAKPITILEMWDGAEWNQVQKQDGQPGLVLNDSNHKSFTFSVPSAEGSFPESKKVNVTSRWMRVRLISGVYGNLISVNIPNATTTGSGQSVTTTQFGFVQATPPRIGQPCFSIELKNESVDPSAVMCVREYLENDSSSDARPSSDQFATDWITVRNVDIGSSIDMSDSALETTGYIYLAFDGPLPSGPVSMLLNRASVDPVKDAMNLECDVLVTDQNSSPQWKLISMTSDETIGLSQMGLIRIELPTMSESPQIALNSLKKGSVHLTPVSQVLPQGTTMLSVFDFYTNGRCLVRDKDHFEEIEIKSVEQTSWSVAQPLINDYDSGKLEPLRPELFGLKRNWLRLNSPSLPPQEGQFQFVMNAVRVVQAQHHNREFLGTSTGQFYQTFRTQYSPVMNDETVLVLEVQGSQCEIELPVLTTELESQGLFGVIMTVQDQNTGRTIEIWVTWQQRSNFLSSGPRDRHYAIDRVSGTVSFGDNRNGRVPPAGATISLTYRHGGGNVGNVAAHTIQQLYTSNPMVRSVTNPDAAVGGCDSESLSQSPDPTIKMSAESRIDRYLRQNTLFRTGGPAAVDRLDYEALARAASVEVADAAFVRQVSQASTASVKIVILPVDSGKLIEDPEFQKKLVYSSTNLPEEWPILRVSDGLTEQVRQLITPLAPAWISRRLDLVGPTVVLFSFSFTSTNPSETITSTASDWLRNTYLNPISGGPDGQGWLSHDDQKFNEVMLLQQIRKILPTIVGCRISRKALKSEPDVSGTQLPRLAAGEIPYAATVTLQQVDPQSRALQPTLSIGVGA